MNFPVSPEDAKVVHGHAGRGVQVVCSCGCINLAYPESTVPTWSCRNCGQVFTHDFARLVEQVLARQTEQPAAASSH